MTQPLNEEIEAINKKKDRIGEENKSTSLKLLLCGGIYVYVQENSSLWMSKQN